MQTNEKQSRLHTVYGDVLLDVLGILIDNDIEFSVEGVSTSERTSMIRITSDPKSRDHKEALENIRSILDDYSHYRFKSDSGSQPIFGRLNGY